MKEDPQIQARFPIDKNGELSSPSGSKMSEATARANVPNEIQAEKLACFSDNANHRRPLLRNKTRSGRSQCLVKAKLVPILLLLVLFIYIPLEKTPLAWLATDSPLFRSIIYRILHPMAAFQEAFFPPTGPSFLNGTIPSITLAPFTFHPLPLGSIKPLGWIDDQMTLMSSGLAGHQYEFYHIVQHSPWLGGHSEYSALNEGLPYWFNGLVPLAYGLNNSRLITQVEDASDYVLNHQQSDGWLGPEAVGERHLWARFPLFLGLTQQAEAEPASAAKIVTAMHRFVHLMHSILIEGTGLDQIWGQVRYPDMIISLQWLYENHPENNAQILLETMYLLKSRGKDWTSYWTESNYIFKDLDLVQPPIRDPSTNFPFTHGVNAVQGLKAGAVLYRFTFNQSLIQTSRDAVNWTMSFHGDPAGSVIGDERESGLAPNRGSELCTAVEIMYSLSYLYQSFGDNTYADRCELAAFNALPVSITSDHWARQYLALPNEPFADQLYGQTPFWNVGGLGLLYGLEPNYPCCTVNMPQGLPKYLSASFVRAGQNGIAHALLGPAEVSTTTASGTTVIITCDTTYPFGPTLIYKISSSAAFTFSLRVPAWASATASSIELNNNGATYPLHPDPTTGMTPVSLPSGTSTVTYTLSTTIRTESRGNNSIAIYHGALLYALDVGQTTAILPATLYTKNGTYHPADGPPNIPPQAQSTAFTNTKPWNIAIDPSTLVFHPSADDNITLKNPIFDYEAPPSYITAKGCQIDWALDRGVPAALPKLPEGAVWNCTGNVTTVVLRPYGSLKIHMAQLPVVDLGARNSTMKMMTDVRRKARWGVV